MKTLPLFTPFLLLLCCLLLQSCISVFMTEGSVDLVKNKFKGPSFSKDDGSGDALGANIAMFYLVGDKGFNGPGYPTGSEPYKSSLMKPNNLMASASNKFTYAPPEPTSFFKSEKFALMPGLELVRKGNRVSDSFGSAATQ